MKISGHVDLCGPELIEGWLYCDTWEGDPIKLQVFIGERLIGECSVDRFRADLQEVGYGDGRCGFSFFLPEALASFNFTETKLRLVNTPVFLLPDEFSNVYKQGNSSAKTGIASAGNTSDHPAPSRKETPEGETKTLSGKSRLSLRTF